MARYAPGLKPEIPYLGITVEPQHKRQQGREVTLNVRLLSSGIAMGGQADDWVGLEPGERFLYRSFHRPENEAQASLRFRIKLKDPKVGKGLLGQDVSIVGYWMFGQDEAKQAEAFAKKQRGVTLVPRRGQDLFDAVQRIQNERLEAKEGSGQDNGLPSNPFGHRGRRRLLTQNPSRV